MENSTGEVKVALLGSGTVGGGVIKVLKQNADVIAQRAGVRIKLDKVLLASQYLKV